MAMIEFNGEYYHDDRMFVLYLCKGKREVHHDHIYTTIYHENPPLDALWYLVTYRNVKRYMAVRVDSFKSKEEAVKYMRKVEPIVPRISLYGRPPIRPLEYNEFAKWKHDNDLKEYDYKSIYSEGGKNHHEVMIGPR
jgi:hypothetical protein